MRSVTPQRPDSSGQDDTSRDQGFFHLLLRPISHWFVRHQHPFNRGIHYLGIPLTLVAVVLFFVCPWSEWYRSALAFVGGYLLQWIGHLIEGNDMGEWAGIKRCLGMPYVAISPRWQKAADEAPSGS
jgi:hypothetical protein